MLHVTKSHVAIPHIYRFSPFHSCYIHRSVFNSFTVLPLTLFLTPFMSQSCLSLLHSVSRSLRLSEVFLSAEPSLLVDRKLNTEIKRVCQFGWWCACTCMAISLFASWSSFVPFSLLPSGVSEMSLLTSSPFLDPRYLWCYSGATGEDKDGGSWSFLLLSCLLWTSVFLHPSSPPPPPPPSPLRPRSQVRLDSGWSHSWAHCRAARLSRSLHSCRWTWGPASAC